MAATIAQTIGIDISKLTLDVFLHPQAIARRFPNTTAGITALLAWLDQTAIHRVIFEPTGAYHRNLERQLGNAGIPMIKVNPLQARRFAEAIGQRAKTDAVDAAMLARFGALDAQRWSRKFGQSDKWIFPRQRGLMAADRSEGHDDETTTPDAFSGFQGQGGDCGDQE